MIKTLVQQTPPLSPDEERTLIVKAQGGDKSANARLLSSWHGLIVKEVSRYATSVEALEEALAEAYVEVLKGIQKLDITRPERPWSLIRWYVKEGAVSALRKSVSAIVVPRLNSACSPSALQARADAMRPHTLFSAPVDGTDYTVGDMMSEQEFVPDTIGRNTLPAGVEKALQGITEAQREVVELRFGLRGQPALSEAETAAYRGTTTSTASTQLLRGLKGLRAALVSA